MSSTDENQGDSNVDDLFDSLGLNTEAAPSAQHLREPEASVEAQQADRDGGGRGWAIIAGVLGLALVLAVGAVVWWLNSSDATETEVTTEATAVDATGVDLDGEAEKLSGVLGQLGLVGVTVEVNEERIVLGGTVPSEQDLSAVRNAVISTSDPALIDMGGITVDPAYGDQQVAGPEGGPDGAPGPGPGPDPGPGRRPPPPNFVPPTPEQQDNLQKELTRVLAETPLVFDPGSTDLNELQLRVLDTTIIGLLEGHPGVPVRLVGYTDESGSEYDNSILSFDRATAVRNYLIANGVPEFIVRAEGRGEDNASGDSGADRRVEIEVIRQP